MAQILDDKSQHCIPFILERLAAHRELHGEDAPPFFIGLNGVQGAGKTTLVSGVFPFYLHSACHIPALAKFPCLQTADGEGDVHLNEPNIWSSMAGLGVKQHLDEISQQSTPRRSIH